MHACAGPPLGGGVCPAEVQAPAWSPRGRSDHAEPWDVGLGVLPGRPESSGLPSSAKAAWCACARPHQGSIKGGGKLVF